MTRIAPCKETPSAHVRGVLGRAFPAAVGAAALALAVAPSGAVGQTEPIAIEPLTERHEFTDDVSGRIDLGVEGLDGKTVEIDDFSRLATVRITVQPGATFPWHTHPGPILAPVTQGELVYIYAEDCVERPYPAGTAFVDPGDNVHTAINPSADEEAVVVATVLGASEDGLLTIPIDDDEGTAMDEKCGIKRG